MEAIYRFHPMFAADGGVKVWFGGAEQDWGRCTIEGGDVLPIGNGAVMIGMGERTTPQAVGLLARTCSPTAPRGSCSPSSCHAPAPSCISTPCSRWSTATRSRCTRTSSRDVRIWALRPGDDPAAIPLVEPFDGNSDRGARARARARRRGVIPTGGDIAGGARAVGRR